ncbi:aldo/keto reductase [Candidatus Omnitrophota bacterium]
MNRIVLGTAQFGMDYGINNMRGRMPTKEAFEILDASIEFGIDTIDTASAYGESEKIIGSFIKNNKGTFKIISKLPKCNHKDIKNIVEQSLEELNITCLQGYLIHSFDHYKNNPKIWEEMESLKKEGKIKKIGFSLYYPREIELLFSKNLKIDIVQVPYSIFDQRFNESFAELKERNVEVFARSVFLQGLIFKKPNLLGMQFTRIRNKIEQLNKLSEELNIPIVSLCVNFARLERRIDKIVIGVDSVDNLKEIMSAETHNLQVKNNINNFYNLRENDEELILPFNWNLQRNN